MDTRGLEVIIFFLIIGAIFIFLKIIGILDLSWWFILLPIYAPLVIAILATATVAAYITIKDRDND